MASIKQFLCLTVLCALSLGCAANSTQAQGESVSPQRLQQLLAPIALYPDTVLTHILIAATYPLEVVQADRWAQQNSGLKGEKAVQAAEHQPWDPSVKALIAFPELLSRMSEDLLWTQELGEAFLADEGATLDAVQTLRQQAWDNGALKDMEHQEVVYEDRQIVIQPVRREVVYVPYYDTRVVYGSWAWSAYPPVYWPRPPRYSGGFYWGYHAPVGNWFYFSGFHWGHRTVVISQHRPYYHYHHHSYGYRQREVERWRHNPHHRRNVRYQTVNSRQHWEHNQPSYHRSERRHEQVTEQLRHHSSRRDAVFGQDQRRENVNRTVRPETQPQHSGANRATSITERRSNINTTPRSRAIMEQSQNQRRVPEARAPATERATPSPTLRPSRPESSDMRRQIQQSPRNISRSVGPSRHSGSPSSRRSLEMRDGRH